jgi:hypothetical protein
MPENALSERVTRIEQKLDVLSDSVDARFEQVDKRFVEVQEHFVEQREYTEFAYDRLDRRMTQGFSRLERKIDQLIDALPRPTAAARRRSRRPKR